jgi:hypothetical protein
MSLYGLLLGKIGRLFLKSAVFKNYLFIGPHPDRYRNRSRRNYRKTGFRRKKSILHHRHRWPLRNYGPTKRWNGEKLIALRQEENSAAAKTLGVNDVTFLPFSDGGLYDPVILTKALAIQIRKTKTGCGIFVRILFCIQSVMPTI